MPGPQSFSKKETKSNPFKAWKERREAKKNALDEQAAMEITNDIARNENAIVGVLQSVDFLHSKLPKEVLEHKDNPELPMGTLEYTARAIIKCITNNPVSISIDMREIDKKILSLAYIFKEAVANGEVRTAHASQTALLRGVREIRMKVPANRPELSKLYIDANSQYLESWITLCGFAQQSDAFEERVVVDRSLLSNAEAANEAEKAAQADEIQNNPEYLDAFATIIENTSLEARASWNEVQREVHLKMVERRMDEVQLELKRIKLVQDEQAFASAQTKLDTLHTKVVSLPIIADPDLMNKFQEEVDLLTKEFSQADVELDETLRAIDDIDGRIQQLDNAPGAVRAREVAADEARKALEDIKRNQDIEAGKGKLKAEDTMKRLGIRNAEEQEQMKRAFETKQAAAVEAIMSEESENGLLYV